SHIRIVLADELASTAPGGRARKTQSAEATAVVADDQATSEPGTTSAPRKSSGRKASAITPKGSTEEKTPKRQSSAKKEKE
ncbi:MAG TPA: hypothetical protein VHY59_04120, partial [Chthoniobacterales bacterium]|nr:hypothetical protein [Chthoniobacterales bacterium]